MARILMLYWTTDGHTRRICEHLKDQLESLQNRVTLMELEACEEGELSACDKLVIGASIRYGKHNPEVYRFIARHQGALESKPSAFFSVNAVARKPEKCTPETNPYVRKFLRQIAWRPDRAAVFAGRINYALYNFWDRNMIRLIMWITKGPTDLASDVVFTDWQQVEEFGRVLDEM